MRSTMQDGALTVQEIYRYGTSLYGDNVVVTATADGSRKTSYAELGERVARLAGALRQLGVSGDQRVGTFMWNNQEHLEAYLAVPSMGAVMHTLNVRLFPDQLVYTADHAEDQVVIADASLVPLLAKTLGDMRTVHTVLVVGEGDRSPLDGSGKLVVDYEEALAGASPDFPWPTIDEFDAAAMCYTSGTTGEPKGVAYSHRSCYLHSSASCMGNGLGISMRDRALPIVPMFHATAWGMPYAAMMAGADLIMPDRFMQAGKLIELIETEKPTVSGAVPTIWNDIMQAMHDEPGHDLSSLRVVVVGGSAVPRSMIETFDKDFGVHIVQGWGMTETSPLASVSHPPLGVTGDAAYDYLSTQGRIVCGVEGRLVDDAGDVQPNDGKAVGEVEVRGPWVTASYYQVADPEKFDDGWLRTGDVGVIDERGYITLTDRAKDVIKSGGEWISSVELENTLAGHPDIAEAAVVGVPDPKWAERPLAAVVLQEGASASADELRGWLAERIAKWQLPERWTFIEAVPRTSVGKFDKKVIRQQFADGDLAVQELA